LSIEKRVFVKSFSTTLSSGLDPHLNEINHLAAEIDPRPLRTVEDGLDRDVQGQEERESGCIKVAGA